MNREHILEQLKSRRLESFNIGKKGEQKQKLNFKERTSELRLVLENNI